MKRRLPPNLYQRTYRTRAGYQQTLFYVQFTDWKGIRRSFPAGPVLQGAKDLCNQLLSQNAQRFDFEKAKSPGPTLFPWIDKFLDLKMAKLSHDKDLRSAKRLKDHFGNCPLDEIVASRIQAYRQGRAKDGLKESSINREIAFLRSVLRLAHQDGALSRMPFILFAPEHNERDRTATEKEYRQLLRLLSPDIRDVIEILWEMGFRISEVLDIEARDLNLKSGVIEMSRIRKKSGLKKPLPLSPRAKALLTARVRRMKKGEGRVFNLTRYQVHWAYRAAAKEKGIMGLWIHDLRGTFATRKEIEGWPRKFIMEFTGHRTENAFRRYSRPTFDHLKQLIGAKRGNRVKSDNILQKQNVKSR